MPKEQSYTLVHEHREGVSVYNFKSFNNVGALYRNLPEIIKRLDINYEEDKNETIEIVCNNDCESINFINDELSASQLRKEHIILKSAESRGELQYGDSSADILKQLDQHPAITDDVVYQQLVRSIFGK